MRVEVKGQERENDVVKFYLMPLNDGSIKLMAEIGRTLNYVVCIAPNGVIRPAADFTSEMPLKWGEPI